MIDLTTLTSLELRRLKYRFAPADPRLRAHLGAPPLVGPITVVVAGQELTLTPDEALALLREIEARCGKPLMPSPV